jgi:hypothetical protein
MADRARRKNPKDLGAELESREPRGNQTCGTTVHVCQSQYKELRTNERTKANLLRQTSFVPLCRLSFNDRQSHARNLRVLFSHHIPLSISRFDPTRPLRPRRNSCTRPVKASHRNSRARWKTGRGFAICRARFVGLGQHYSPFHLVWVLPSFSCPWRRWC